MSYFGEIVDYVRERNFPNGWRDSASQYADLGLVLLIEALQDQIPDKADINIDAIGDVADYLRHWSMPYITTTAVAALHEFSRVCSLARYRALNVSDLTADYATAIASRTARNLLGGAIIYGKPEEWLNAASGTAIMEAIRSLVVPRAIDHHSRQLPAHDVAISK
ncbi:MAG: hypothetical protein ABH879_00765 [archaeon]